MPITNRPDPQYEQEEFASFADGKYTVNGLVWFTVDEEGAPIFVVQSNSTNLVARYRTQIGENDGPPGSVTPGEIPLLVKAFGGDPKSLPSKDDPTAYLIAARDMINTSEKDVSVDVSGGWVSRIQGMSLPKDQYFRFRVARITTRNEQEQPAWKQGTFGNYIGVEFEVIADMMGHSTPYDGARIWESISYGLKIGDDGSPAFTTKDDGNPTPAASQTDRFLSAFAPEIYDTGFENAGNILPEFWEMYKKNRRAAVTQVISVGRERKRIGLNVYGFASIDTSEPDGAEAPAIEIDDAAKASSIMDQIYTVIETGVGEKAFGDDGNLNTKGKAWCKDNLAPFLKSNSWPKRFALWDADQQVAVLKHLTSVTASDDGDF